MANVVDTIEIHKAVEDPDRVDTSAGNTAVTLRVLDTGEVNVVGEYLGQQFEQTIPAGSGPRLLIFDAATTAVRSIPVELGPSEKILYALTD